jgi:hypothetical protein
LTCSSSRTPRGRPRRPWTTAKAEVEASVDRRRRSSCAVSVPSRGPGWGLRVSPGSPGVPQGLGNVLFFVGSELERGAGGGGGRSVTVLAGEFSSPAPLPSPLCTSCPPTPSQAKMRAASFNPLRMTTARPVRASRTSTVKVRSLSPPNPSLTGRPRRRCACLADALLVHVFVSESVFSRGCVENEQDSPSLFGGPLLPFVSSLIPSSPARPLFPLPLSQKQVQSVATFDR